MDLNDLSDEMRAKVAACTSPEELMALAKEEGRELTDEELESIAGGWDFLDKLTNVPGDERDDIDEARVPEAFRTGELRGDGLD